MPELISSARQSRELDEQTIEGWGVPGIALMELASKGVADALLERFAEEAMRGVAVLCGVGNNGGDGFAVARWLFLAGVDVVLVPLGTASAGDAHIMRRAAERLGIPQMEAVPVTGVFVDALFGTGLTRGIEGRAAELLRTVEAERVVAVDLPSGLHADTGAVLGPVVPADLTVTFGRRKPAFFSPNADLAGEVVVVDIGVARGGHATAERPFLQELSAFWPWRMVESHKRSSGHVAIVAGSVEMAGAAVLACLGAVRAGAGLVTLLIAPEALGRLRDLPASVMVEALDAEQALGRLERFDAVAVGPGLGGGRPLSEGVKDGINRLVGTAQPVVLDADALFPGQPDGHKVVRTPHPGEAGRLLGVTAREVQSDRFRWVTQLPGCALLKGRHTLIHQEGRTSVNPTNSTVLATAGSGDVLTGVIAALLARGLEPFDAARLGAWVHGRAGEILEARRAEGWNANDIASALPEAIEELRDVSR